MRTRTAFVAGMLAAALSTSTPARAQTAADKLAAQKLLTQGNQAVGDGDYLTALDRFKQAYARFKSPKVLVNIGSAQRLLGRYVDAAATYEAFLADPAADQARVPEVTRLLYEIDALLARVRISVKQGDAKVTLDGNEIPKFTSGMVVRVEAGSHTVIGTREGFPPVVRPLAARAGDQLDVQLEIKAPETIVVRTAGPQRTFGVVVGSLGGAAVIAGFAAGAAALAEKRSATAHCFGSTGECDPQGVSLISRTTALGNASTGLLIAGLAVVGVGVTLILTAPTTTTTRGTARPSSFRGLSF